MRRFMGLLVLVTLLVGLIAAGGCGGTKSGTINTPEGNISYDAAKKQVTVTSNGKTTTWSVQSAAEATLGVPVPSNAKVQQGSVAVVSTTEGNQKWSGATYWSPDDVNTVVEYYKSQLSGMTGYTDASTTQDGVLIGLFAVRTGDSTKSIVVGAGKSGDPGKTKIVISTATGTGITGTQ
jgi:hypothetical protein